MKYIMLLSFFSFFACKTVDKTTTSEKLNLAVFSKGACLGKCPVYDITVYNDGSYHYEGIKHVETTGTVSGTLSAERFTELTELLNANKNNDYTFKKIRDKPVITLKHKNIKTMFYASSAPASLKAIDNWFDSFLDKMSKSSN